MLKNLETIQTEALIKDENFIEAFDKIGEFKETDDNVKILH